MTASEMAIVYTVYCKLYNTLVTKVVQLKMNGKAHSYPQYDRQPRPAGPELVDTTPNAGFAGWGRARTRGA